MTSPQQPQSAPPARRYTVPLVAPTSRLAVVSLVVGVIAILAVCIIPVLPGAAALILALLAFRHTGPMQMAGRGLAIAGLALGAVALVLSVLGLSITLPLLRQARETAHRTDCGENLRLVGQALRQYAASDADGAFPPDLDTLAGSAQLAPDIFICPSGPEEASAAGQPLRFSQNLSYVYAGSGLGDDAPANAVLVYEPVENHGRDGAHFLMADGTVRFLTQNDARQAISQLQKGVNPPSGSQSSATRASDP